MTHTNHKMYKRIKVKLKSLQLLNCLIFLMDSNSI